MLALTVILSAGIGLSSLQYIEKAKQLAARTQIETFRIALQTLYVDCGVYPSTGQGLDALFTKPILSPVPEKWNGPYLDRKIPYDPWNKEYEYSSPGPDGLPFAIASRGRDGREGGNGHDEDILSWE